MWCNVNCTGTQPVGTKEANELSLYDMSGNVFEWCSNLYSPTLEVYKSNTEGVIKGEERVVKGGSWLEKEGHSLPIRRAPFYPNEFYPDLGFRLVLDK